MTYNYFLLFHHYWAFLVLMMLIVFTVVSLLFFFKRKILTPFIRRLSFLTLFTVHLQALAGIILLILYLTQEHDPIMGNSVLRRNFVEHPTMMISAAFVLTIINTKLKKYNKCQLWIIITLILILTLILTMIPQSFWQNLVL